MMSQRVEDMTLGQRIGMNVFLFRHTLEPHMTQEELAEKAGLSINTVANVEANRVLADKPISMRVDTVEKLAEALGVPTLDLMKNPFPDDWPTRVYTEGLVQGSGADALLDLTKVPA